LGWTLRAAARWLKALRLSPCIFPAAEAHENPPT
jgi:hypothetical protein